MSPLTEADIAVLAIAAFCVAVVYAAANWMAGA